MKVRSFLKKLKDSCFNPNCIIRKLVIINGKEVSGIEVDEINKDVDKIFSEASKELDKVFSKFDNVFRKVESKVK